MSVSVTKQSDIWFVCKIHEVFRFCDVRYFPLGICRRAVLQFSKFVFVVWESQISWNINDSQRFWCILFVLFGRNSDICPRFKDLNQKCFCYLVHFANNTTKLSCGVWNILQHRRNVAEINKQFSNPHDTMPMTSERREWEVEME